MSKIIIYNDSTMTDEEVIRRVMSVMADGRVSRDKTSYCAHTYFIASGLCVSADVTKTGTDVFRVWDKVSE